MKVLICDNCGAISQATDDNGNPVCAICIGITEYNLVERELPEEFTIKCSDCAKTLTYKEGQWYYKNGNVSTYDVPPFLNLDTKRFYCGCCGWN
jgi:NMD protein affecting ribosome stability and mRNA decay